MWLQKKHSSFFILLFVAIVVNAQEEVESIKMPLSIYTLSKSSLILSNDIKFSSKKLVFLQVETENRRYFPASTNNYGEKSRKLVNETLQENDRVKQMESTFFREYDLNDYLLQPER